MLSRISLLLAATLMSYASFFFYPKWKHSTTEAAISWDVSGYYWYLPSVFIYKDLKHQFFKDSILNKYQPTNTDFQQGWQLSNGNYVMKYSSGMALMYLPFFTAAHIVAKILGYARDGFSAPYQFAIQLGGLLIALIGLWYLRKLLLLFYSDQVVAIVLLLLVAGSNYIDYAAINCGMSHCWLFTVYVFLLLNTCYFYQSFSMKYAIRIGLLVGIAALTRPTDAIACLIPLLWNMESISMTALKNRAKLIAAKHRQFLASIVCACLVISIQLIYWKYVSGHWLVYSYGDQGFYWRHPHIYLYTFSYRSGWLVYSPIMVLAFIGIAPFIKYGQNKVAILCFFAINYYLVCAWDVWWYGGRAMIQSYPVLLFPIAALIDFIIKKRSLLYLFIPIALLLTYFNIWLTVQCHGGGLYDCDNMTKAYFWSVIGRWHVPASTIFLRDNTEICRPTSAQMDFVYQNNLMMNDTGCYLNKKQQQSPVYSFAYHGGAKWIKASATFRCVSKEWIWYRMPQFIVRLIDKNKKGREAIIKENMIRPGRIIEDGQTKTVAIDMQLPTQHYDSVSILFWNADSDKEMQISDLEVWQLND